MKASGTVRRIDDLGRIVIPKEIRKHIRICEGSPMEIFVTEEGVLLKKYYPEENLSELLTVINDEVEELCKDLGPERTGDIRRHLRDIQKVLNPEGKH